MKDAGEFAQEIDQRFGKTFVLQKMVKKLDRSWIDSYGITKGRMQCGQATAMPRIAGSSATAEWQCGQAIAEGFICGAGAMCRGGAGAGRCGPRTDGLLPAGIATGARLG